MTLFYSNWCAFVWLILSIKLAGWVNRFANAGDTAVVVAENTAVKVRVVYIICS
jgi:hypothetical protein